MTKLKILTTYSSWKWEGVPQKSTLFHKPYEVNKSSMKVFLKIKRSFILTFVEATFEVVDVNR